MNRGTKISLLGGIAAVALWAALHVTSATYAQGDRVQAVRPDEIAPVSLLRLDAGDLGDHVVMVDPNANVLSVYYIQRETGVINLRSVRNISWDMQLEEYNPSTPSPKDIRAVIEGRN